MHATIPTALLAVLAASPLASAHYANMGLDGISCYIYNGIKGTTPGHMIVRNADNTWSDHDDAANHGTITVVRSQQEYDALPVKTKTGIVCSPDEVDTTEIGVPYVEMEPSDEDFYKPEPTILKGYQPQARSAALGRRTSWHKYPGVSCVIKFCLNSSL